MKQKRRHEKRRRREWGTLQATLGSLLKKYGKTDALGHGDCWLLDDDMGNWTQSVFFWKVKLLKTDLVLQLWALLDDYPDWTIVITLDVPGKRWPEMGLIVHKDGIQDDLVRDVLPAYAADLRFLPEVAAPPPYARATQLIDPARRARWRAIRKELLRLIRPYGGRASEAGDPRLALPEVDFAPDTQVLLVRHDAEVPDALLQSLHALLRRRFRRWTIEIWRRDEARDGVTQELYLIFKDEILDRRHLDISDAEAAPASQPKRAKKPPKARTR